MFAYYSNGTPGKDHAMPNVVFFEICVDDLNAAASFYSRVFGWNIEQGDADSDGWVITTGDDEDPGIPGALSSRYDELSSTVCTIEVPSVAEYARKVTEAGGRVVAPQITLPGEGFMQYCEDLEGNGFAIMEYLGETE
jgi:predicted enzyme related to lactoylglutathione lyase